MGVGRTPGRTPWSALGNRYYIESGSLPVAAPRPEGSDTTVPLVPGSW
jgi:hypothetical protein